MPEPVLSVRGLEVAFTGSGRSVPAVRGIDLDVHPNEVLGIVGESGSGKSVTARSVMRLLDEGARIAGGSIVFRGRDSIADRMDDTPSIEDRFKHAVQRRFQAQSTLRSAECKEEQFAVAYTESAAGVVP